MTYVLSILGETWGLLLDSGIYILFGIFVAGLLKMYLSPEYVARNLGEGRFASVFKAALLGIPIPLCSCGVLPAAASLKKQGANNGATAAFLIATPESGVDSISITYALLDPVMTVARPVAAFITAITAGIGENLLNPPRPPANGNGLQSCVVDACCDGVECSPTEHANHHSFAEKFRAGLGYAVRDLWGDLAGWFAIGLLIAGVISALIPDDIIGSYLGGGIGSMLLMLLIGIPLYICATASTPIAAAMILKGVSPGAALVFLLVGPATNMASLSVLFGFLGKRATALYLTAIAVMSVISGLVLDMVYELSGISAQATVGQAAEFIPVWVKIVGVIILAIISVKPLLNILRGWFLRGSGAEESAAVSDCCGSDSCVTE